MAFTVTALAPIEAEALLPIERVRQHCRVDDTDQDEQLGVYRAAALDWVERHTARALTRRAFRFVGDSFATTIRLPVGPVWAVTAVGYVDPAGATVVLTSADWRAAGDCLLPGPGKRWPTTLAGSAVVTVELEAGYLDAAAEAPALVQAALLLIGQYHSAREAVITGTIATEAPLGVVALCAPYRTPVLG